MHEIDQAMSYKLYIDDDPKFRPTPIENNVVWMRAYSNTGALDIIERYGYPDHISFDHDLGKNQVVTEFITIILTKLIDEHKDIPFSYDIHSKNPLAKERIDSLFQSYYKVIK